jgi:hypothetical protein
VKKLIEKIKKQREKREMEKQERDGLGAETSVVLSKADLKFLKQKHKKKS